jgi:hypothetical protein
MTSLAWRRLFAGAFVASGAIAGGVSWAFGQSKNLLVFRHASEALLAGGDLYVRWLDFFKYSPTFALLFVPLALVPGWLAAVVWGALNFAVAFAGIDAVTPEPSKKRAALALSLAGILLATDGDQSNLLVAGLMLLAFAALERRRTLAFAVLVALGAHVKLFPILAGLFALMHPRPARSLAALAGAVAALALSPLAVVSPATLAAEYASWARLVGADHAHRGWSLMTMLEDGLGLRPESAFVQILGAGLLVAPLLASRAPTDAGFRRTFAASVLAFSVLFNHRSEYATFVVSAIGVALWYADAPRTPLRRAIVAFALVAHGPLLALPDPSLGGALGFLAAHRVFHPLRVLPLAAAWSMMLFDLVYARVLAELFARAARRAAERTNGPVAERAP